MNANLHRRTSSACLVVLALLSLSLAPAAGAAPPRVADLRGEWAWTCCDGTYGGRFQITTVDPQHGAFSGRFMHTNASDVGTINGSLRGDRVTFVRRVNYDRTNYEQTFYARLEYTDGAWHMVEGYWNGYGETGVASRTFGADKVS